MLNYGTVTAIGATISSLTEPYHYSGKDNSLFGGVFITSGIIGSVIAGIILDRLHLYKLMTVIIGIASTILVTLCFLTLPTGSTSLFTPNLLLFGFFSIPLTPISFAFSVELTYPVPESISNGMLILPAKVYGALLSVIASILASIDPKYAITLFCVNNAIAALCTFFIVEDLRRLKPKEREVEKSNE